MSELHRLRLGVLDLCRRSADRPVRDSLEEILLQAELTDRLGYSRFWVAEHHLQDSAEACPEVLVGLIAARTRWLRVGAGAVLLPYYSPLKVAETFLTLEALFPGRIDLGVARGPGVPSGATAQALVSGNAVELTDAAFDQKVRDLSEYLSAAVEHRSIDYTVARAIPWGVVPPPVWVLGSSLKSMQLAATLGYPYAIARFYEPAASLGPEIMSQYRQEMAARHPAARPQSCLAVTVICMDRGEDARQRQADLVSQGILASYVVGSPQDCCSQIRDLAEQYQLDEILVTTWMQQHDDRCTMYSRLAEEFELTARS